MPDLTILLGVAAIFVVLSVVQTIRVATANRERDEAVTELNSAKLDHAAQRSALGKAIIQVSTAFVADTIEKVLDEVVTLEKETGLDLADSLLGHAYDPLGHAYDPLADLLFGTPNRDETATAVSQRLRLDRANIESLLRDGFRLTTFSGKPAFIRPRSFMWGPGDPIPTDAPAEVQDMLRTLQADFDAGKGLPSLDDLKATAASGGFDVKASGPYDALVDDGTNPAFRPGGSADPLADPTASYGRTTKPFVPGNDPAQDQA